MERRRTQAEVRGAGSAARRRIASIIGWGAAAVALVVLAIIVGKPTSQDGSSTRSVTPSASASASAVLPITFGSGLDPVSNVASPQTSRFGTGDTLAYSVTFDQPPGVATVLVQVLRVESPAPVEVQPPTEQAIQPGELTLGVELPADRLLTAWGAGDYEMRISLAAGQAPVATGGFTLLATP